MAAFRECNKYIDTREPWKSRKTDRDLCAATINTCAQAVRTLGVVLEPYLPFAAEKIRAMMGLSSEQWRWPHATAPLPEGHQLGPVPEVLFRKLDPAAFDV
jgi:methionyl-tRNA synthetase